MQKQDLLLPRRWLLQGAAGLALSGFVPERVMAAAPGAVMPTLSAYMSGAGTRKLPDAVVEKSKQMILDTLAAMISGSQLAPGKVALTFARANSGDKTATVV
ncbi:MAG: MmgE/PrpD family protein, partial [Alphaproteobacteria bacterium]|nr:MmgE/PrpD family protein [Alphaproteobacteria bacterium]